METQLLEGLRKHVGLSLNRWIIMSGLTPIRMVNGNAVVETGNQSFEYTEGIFVRFLVRLFVLSYCYGERLGYF